MSERFSKPNLLAALERRADELKKKHGFDETNGTAQLIGKLAGQDAAVAYGEFRLCHDLMQQIDDGSVLRR
jgi:tetrahydromethanopterin S-methyltransferase subunit G